MYDNSALKLHALIRALHLDVSLAVTWAFMGQIFRESDEMKLAKQAFDCARSIDPTLALPWAGSADTYARESTSDEAFESCLRATQILPLAEFQVGLAWLALLHGNISSPQIFACIEQAVQRTPYYPESHNFHGLVCEARCNYHTAIASYRLALAAMSVCPDNPAKSHVGKISINLVRSLSKDLSLQEVETVSILKQVMEEKNGQGVSIARRHMLGFIEGNTLQKRTHICRCR